MDRLQKQIEKLDQEISRAQAAATDAQAALDKAIDSLADSNDHRAVDAGRRSLDQSRDRLTGLCRKRDRLQADLDRLQSEHDRAEKTARLKTLLAENEGAIRRHKAINFALRFEGATRDHRLQMLDREHRELSAATSKMEAEIKMLSAELDQAVDFESLHTAEVSDDEVREILLDFGVSDTFCRWPLSQARTHQRPLIP